MFADAQEARESLTHLGKAYFFHQAAVGGHYVSKSKSEAVFLLILRLVSVA